MMKRFFFHYNKPASQAQGCTVWSIHYNGSCHLVLEIDCKVPTQSKSNARQPRAVIVGKCDKITIVNERAIIE
jgi:hypothetical protein